MTLRLHTVASATAGVGSTQKDNHHDMKTTSDGMYSALQDEIKRMQDDMMTVKGDVKSLLLIMGGVDWGRERAGVSAERSRPTAKKAPPSSIGKNADGDGDNNKTGGVIGEKSTELKPSSIGGMPQRNSFSMSDPALLTSSLRSLGPQGSRADNLDVGGVGAAAEFSSAMQQDVEDIADIHVTVARDYRTKKKNRPKKKKNMKRRRMGQKQQDVSKASDKNENWGGAAAAGSGRMTIVVGALMGLFAFFTCAQGIMGGKDWNRGGGPPSRRGRVVRMMPATVDDEDAHPPPKDYTLGENKNKKMSSGDAFLRNLQADSSESTNPMISTTDDLASDEVLIPYLYTYSPSHSPAFVCNDDPENCGCLNLYQADYRGSINTTKTGKDCVRWDDENLIKYQMNTFCSNDVELFPEAGLKDNFCRNPDPWHPRARAWCYTGPIAGDLGGFWDAEECDVPACDSPHTSGLFIPMSSSRPMLSTSPSIAPTFASRPTKIPLSSPSLTPTLSSSPSNTCHYADNSKCGCEVVHKSDYRGSISITEDGTECERWDAEWISFSEQTKVEKGLYGNYCRDPFDDNDGPACYTSADNFGINGLPKLSLCVIPTCDSCSCMPECGQPNLVSKCGCPSALQAERCCDDSDYPCKCDYLKTACRISLENNMTDFCDDMEAACLAISHSSNRCAVYEQMCFDYPSESTCAVAAEKCCKDVEVHSGVLASCFCDFYTSIKNVRGYETEHRSGNCSDAALGIGPLDLFGVDYEANFILPGLYSNLGGDYWYKNSGWMDPTIPHCEWYGITCNEDGWVTKINLRNNNLTGTGYGVFLQLVGAFKELKVLDLAENNLSGHLPYDYLRTFVKLEHIDISNNAFTGYAEMAFPSSTSYVNFSHNRFERFDFFRFNAAYETLKVVDLSNNHISQDTSSVFLNIPPNIQELILASNSITGKLPDPFPLENLIRFVMADNLIEGNMPDFPGSSPLLRELDLSNQNRENGGGLIGTISKEIFKLGDLSTLNLAGNKLSGDIPASTGNLAKLKVLNLSSNVLSKQIPAELGRLKGVIEILDLSHNVLSGLIPPGLDALEILDLSYNNLSGVLPSEFGHYGGVSIRLRNNSAVTYPAPLMLCFLPGFDLIDNTKYCPIERNALKEFYNSAKGTEWTVDENWLDPHIGHCDWYGVKCNDANNTVKLELQSNGLSGTLTPNISTLSSLDVLDLNDNNIKGSIPTEIGLLSNLTRLRLSYNEFTGHRTNFANLQRLKLIHLHGNRLSGSIPEINLDLKDTYAFISDCGQPSDFERALVCEECTMCCNNEANCMPRISVFPLSSIEKPTKLVLQFIACFIGASCVLALAIVAREKYRDRNITRSPIRPQSSLTDRDQKYASEHLGENSVYQFFLGTSKWGWSIVLATIITQIWILSIFVGGSKRDLASDKVDMVYTWKCTRDQDECFDTNDLDWRGWLAFVVLMLTHLLKDGICGLKMIKYSAKQRHGRYARIRLFIGGAFLTMITAFTTYVSTMYNMAIATSNTDIITNSVIILFICDIDELLYGILMFFPGWVKSMSQDAVLDSEFSKRDDGLEASRHQHGGNPELEVKVASLEEKVRMLSQNMTLLLDHSPDLARLLAATTTDKEKEKDKDDFDRFVA